MDTDRPKKAPKYGMDGSVERRGFANSVRINTTEKAYQVGHGVGYLIHLGIRWEKVACPVFARGPVLGL